MTKMTRLKMPLTLALGLAAAIVLASCSQSTTTPSSGPSPSTSSAPSAATSSPPSASSSKSAGQRIDIGVTGKQVTPDPSLVNIAVGESLTVTVTSDHDDTLHAHGFAVEKDVKAGRPVSVTVKGGKPGVYEFELHDPKLRLFQVAVH